MTDVDMAANWPFGHHWRRPTEGDVVSVVARSAGKLMVEHDHGHDPTWVTCDSASEWHRIGSEKQL